MRLAAFVVLRENIKHVNAFLQQLHQSRREAGDDDVTITQEILEQVPGRAKVAIQNPLVDAHLPYRFSSNLNRTQLRWTPIR